MLSKLQSIRRLLISPTPGNIHVANAELETLAPAVAGLLGLLPAQRESVPAMLVSLAGIRSELSAIATLSQKALDYFNRLGQLRASKSGAYGRNGEWKCPDTASRVTMRL
jgi:hypothetical protein